MVVRTTHNFNVPAETAWSLLFHSKMDNDKPCYFLFGLPKPVECRLENGQGGVGETRECVSDKGVIKQTILEWEPNKKLAFELRETNIYFGPCVESIIENFQIKSTLSNKSSVTRTTIFNVKRGRNVDYDANVDWLKSNP